MDDRFNTAAGWVLFAGIVGLGLAILSGKYFHADNPERPEQLGYVIEGVETEEEESGPSLATLIASATAAQGEAVFAKCMACHTVEQGGANGVGPNLYGVMGAAKAAKSGFGYSSALSGMGGEWTWENMDAWLASPRGYAAGTTMSFAGLSSPEDRAAVMIYLQSYGGVAERPEEAPAEETAEAEAEADASDEAEAAAEQDAAAEVNEGGE